MRAILVLRGPAHWVFAIIRRMAHPTILTVLCAWCGKDMGQKDGKGQSGTSHGICVKCAGIHKM